jgi:phage tail sheath gpL-like
MELEISEVPKGTRLPFTYLQFDSSLASAGLEGVQPYRSLLIGTHGTGGSDATFDKPIRINSENEAKTKFGDGSVLHQMARAYLKNSTIEVWAAALTPSATLGADPDLGALIGNIKGMQFNVIASGFSSQSLLSSLAKELDSRAKATRAIEGIAIAAIPGDSVAATSGISGINSQFLCVVPMSGIPSQPHEVAAALCGVVATSAHEDPARPFRTLELASILPPPPDSTEGRVAREAALNAGVSTLYTDSSNTVRIERLVTTRLKNELGADDSSYMSPATVFTLSFLRWDFARYFGLKYPRHKLASDKYRGSGPVMTPSTARAECVCLFRKWEEQGLVQDADGFINGLVCEISKSDPTRLNILLPTRLVSELDVIGAKVRFLF